MPDSNMTIWSHRIQVPKTTFFNLNESKRAAIEAAATKEFGAYGFYGARLNHIVTGAGIAKGSFYQYFDNLEDLYFHLLELYANQKLELIEEVLAQHEEADFFTKYRLIYLATLSFVKNVSDDVLLMSEHDAPGYHLNTNLYDQIRRRSEEKIFRPMIARAIDKGEITGDADFAFVVIANSSRMIQQYMRRSEGAGSMREIYRKGNKLDSVIERFINFLKAGLTGLPKDKES